ncbi:MAG: hypothetical protein KAU26_05565 [Methylococcales bacterium]|nr:hypothetical protein [Methylococcales bacterium]
MKKTNVALVKLLQFIIFVIFTFTVLIYFSAIVLLPLEIVSLLIKLLGLLGVGSLIAALLAIPAVGYLCFIAYKIPNLGKMVIDTGIDLVNTGKARIEAFNELADEMRK